ncbi:chaplin [Streptomyces albidus (ex Kaewkla and Franco 2022)]|uniref:chaplin n=1 Tax=Streptomyces albidus (ex Kaewkla and Franco 2022) TaxID=722709 RepID=UPI0015EE65F8|nr:chaplin [Streptomyces albidus (ex Kaewkla and Franco 2022)]
MIKKVAAVAVAAGGLVFAGAGMAVAQQGVQGTASGGGLVSGNSVQAPVNIPVNVCGNTVSALGFMNSAGGSACPGR